MTKIKAVPGIFALIGMSDPHPDDWKILKVVWSDQHGLVAAPDESESEHPEYLRAYYDHDRIIAVASKASVLKAQRDQAQAIYDKHYEEYSKVMRNGPGAIHQAMRQEIAKKLKIPQPHLTNLLLGR